MDDADSCYVANTPPKEAIQFGAAAAAAGGGAAAAAGESTTSSRDWNSYLECQLQRPRLRLQLGFDSAVVVYTR